MRLFHRENFGSGSAGPRLQRSYERMILNNLTTSPDGPVPMAHPSATFQA